MGFSLREIVGQLPDHLEPIFQCPTNKRPFDTKASAQAALRRVNPHLRTAMRTFRCGYCERYHLGHRRGHRS